MSEQEPNEEELRAALEEQMKHIRVEDVVLQTIVTLINLGARRLGIAGSPEEAGEKDLGQAQLAIEGARALLALVDGEGLDQVRNALSQLQMAFVQQAQGEPAADSSQPAEETQTQTQTQEDEERAKARSKLWTPPGT
jgi:hypothetical protein